MEFFFNIDYNYKFFQAQLTCYHRQSGMGVLTSKITIGLSSHCKDRNFEKKGTLT